MLKNILLKIKNKSSVNHKMLKKHFYKKFPEKRMEDIFDVQQISANSSLVFIKNEEEFSYILNKLNESDNLVASNRLKATIDGNSHSSKISTYYILVFHENTDLVKPDVVVINENHFTQTFQNKNKLIVIENQENFSHFIKHLNYMNKFDKEQLTYSIKEYDVMFCSGQSLSNKRVSQFLNQYQQIVFSLDLDIGGIRIFNSMSNILNNNVKYNFWTPKNLNEIFRQYGNFLSLEEREILFSNKKLENEATFHIIEKIKNTNKKVEQEIYLHPQYQ